MAAPIGRSILARQLSPPNFRPPAFLAILAISQADLRNPQAYIRPRITPAPEALNNRKSPDLADAATLLLPGLQHARSLLDVAIRVLSHFANPPPQAALSNAEAAAKIRRLLAEFGHPAARR